MGSASWRKMDGPSHISGLRTSPSRWCQSCLAWAADSWCIDCISRFLSGAHRSTAHWKPVERKSSTMSRLQPGVNTFDKKTIVWMITVVPITCTALQINNYTILVCSTAVEPGVALKQCYLTSRSLVQQLYGEKNTSTIQVGWNSPCLLSMRRHI